MLKSSQNLPSMVWYCNLIINSFLKSPVKCDFYFWLTPPTPVPGQALFLQCDVLNVAQGKVLVLCVNLQNVDWRQSFESLNVFGNWYSTEKLNVQNLHLIEFETWNGNDSVIGVQCNFLFIPFLYFRFKASVKQITSSSSFKILGKRCTSAHFAPKHLPENMMLQIMSDNILACSLTNANFARLCLFMQDLYINIQKGNILYR